MTTKSDYLAEMRQAFSRRWKPPEEDYLRHEFEVDVDRLIYAAFVAAQEPFVRELEMFRDHTLKTAMLATSPLKP